MNGVALLAVVNRELEHPAAPGKAAVTNSIWERKENGDSAAGRPRVGQEIGRGPEPIGSPAALGNRPAEAVKAKRWPDLGAAAGPRVFQQVECAAHAGTT